MVSNLLEYTGRSAVFLDVDIFGLYVLCDSLYAVNCKILQRGSWSIPFELG